jgi:hypothetical protein
VTYQDPDDQIVVVARAQVQRRILAALVTPRKKWQLREALHLPEHILAAELKTLRAAGQVKCVGRQQADLAWVVRGWAPSAPPAAPDQRVNEYTVIRTAKAKPAADSWWTRSNLTRAQFQARALKGADA